VTFGIDYHGTFSRDPDAFREMVKALQYRGHTCVLVTGIADGDRFAAEVRREVGNLMPIVFANNAWKRDMAKAAGFDVDVWIDDSPEWIRPSRNGFVEERTRATEKLIGGTVPS